MFATLLGIPLDNGKALSDAIWTVCLGVQIVIFYDSREVEIAVKASKVG